MRIDLKQLAVDGLTLNLPGEGPSQTVGVRSAEGLSGSFETATDGFRLSDMACHALVLEALTLRFGSVGLALEGTGGMRGVKVDASSTAGVLTSRARADRLEAARLTITVGDTLALTAELCADAFELGLDGSDGFVAASEAALASISLRTGTVEVSAPALHCTKLRVGWGTAGFQLEAELAHAGALTAIVGPSEVRAGETTLRGLAIHAGEIHLTSGEIGSLQVQAPLGSGGAKEPSAPHAVASARPTLDYRLLDELFGHIHADVHVDMTVPVIGRRRATHSVRIAVDQGTVDYRALEHSLSALEDSILDFSLREGALVLELGVPLLSTRGRGKPLLIWDLDESDYTLAEQRRVRLAVLPKLRVAGGDKNDRPSEPDRESKSSFALRQMVVSPIDVEVALRPAAAPRDAAIETLTLSQLKVTGELQHVPGTEKPGRLYVTGGALATRIVDMAVGTSALSATLEVGEVDETQVAFAGLRPTAVQGALARVVLRDVAFVPSKVDVAHS